MGMLGAILFNLRNMKRANKIRSMSKAQLLALDDEALFEAVECVCRDAAYEITAPELIDEQRYVYALTQFEMEVNNGGLCQFFVNSSRECAPYISSALRAVGAHGLQKLYDDFVSHNGIDVSDLSSFIVNDVAEYQKQTERFDFDSFDDHFYANEDLHRQIIDYSRRNIDSIVR